MNLLKYNGYDFSPATVARVISAKQNHEILPDKWDDLHVKDGQLFVGNLAVVPTNRIDEVLKEVYADPITGLGRGKRKFYESVSAKFVGISRERAGEFLEQQHVYQLTKPQHHVINKPIYAKVPSERFAIDLMDLKPYFIALDQDGNLANKGFRYVLTCIDFNTRYCWGEAIKFKTAFNVREAMNKICHRAGDTFPKILQADHGSEFRGLMQLWREEHDIRNVNSRSYTPEANGLVESCNKELWKNLRQFI